MSSKKRKQSLRIGPVKIVGIKMSPAPDEQKRAEDRTKASPSPRVAEETKGMPGKSFPLSLMTAGIAFIILLLGGIPLFVIGMDTTPPKITVLEPQLSRGERRVAEDQSTLIKGIAEDKAGIAFFSLNSSQLSLPDKFT